MYTNKLISHTPDLRFNSNFAGLVNLVPFNCVPNFKKIHMVLLPFPYVTCATIHPRKLIQLPKSKHLRRKWKNLNSFECKNQQNTLKISPFYRFLPLDPAETQRRDLLWSWLHPPRLPPFHRLRPRHQNHRKKTEQQIGKGREGELSKIRILQ